jgi:Tol biopolymer transport system component
MNLYLSINKVVKRIVVFCLCLFLIPIMLNSQNDKNENYQTITTQYLQGEKIFFTKHKYEYGIVMGDIYSMDPYGGNVQQLTNFSKDFFITERPEISSDGTKLAFCSNYEEWKSSNYFDAFILDFATGNFKRVTGFEKTTQTTETGTVNVTVSDPQGYATTPSAIRISYRGCSDFVTGNSATLTVPANEEIWIKAEVARAKGDVEIITVPSGGNSSVQLNLMDGTITAESCSPSPNGNNMAVSRNSETISQEGEAFPWYKILIWDTNQSNPLAEAGGLKQNGDKHPAYSHDGSKLAVCTGELFSNSLAVLSTTNITTTPTILVEGKRFPNQEFCSDPTWSPNSSEIVFVYTIINSLGNLQANLYKVSANGGTSVQLTFYSGNEIVSRPSYSPDGTKIAFSLLKSKSITFTFFDWVFANFTGDICIIPSNGGSPVSITNDGNAIDPSWGVVSTAVSVADQDKIPDSYQLYQNYPNPYNSSTTIKYDIPVNKKNDLLNVKLIVYDVLGNEIAILVNEVIPPGEYETNFDGNGLSSGIYFYQLIVDDFVEIKKMILLK